METGEAKENDCKEFSDQNTSTAEIDVGALTNTDETSTVGTTIDGSNQLLNSMQEDVRILSDATQIALYEEDDNRTRLSNVPVSSITELTSIQVPAEKDHKVTTRYVYDPEKISVRFLFANRDGIDVTVRCDPSDTVGDLKGRLLSLWPQELAGKVVTGEQIRLICMGKGLLSPDVRTLSECGVPVFETHATPVNVSIRPEYIKLEEALPSSGPKKNVAETTSASGGIPSSNSSDCCIIL